MTATSLSSTVHMLSTDGPAIPIIDLHGEIDSQAEAALNAAYAAATATDPPAVVLNFSGVTYINSTGIALIVGLLVQARKAGRRLHGCGLSEHYIEIFQITRLVDYLKVYPDEQAAVDAFQTEQN